MSRVVEERSSKRNKERKTRYNGIMVKLSLCCNLSFSAVCFGSHAGRAFNTGPCHFISLTSASLFTLFTSYDSCIHFVVKQSRILLSVVLNCTCCYHGDHMETLSVSYFPFNPLDRDVFVDLEDKSGDNA